MEEVEPFAMKHMMNMFIFKITRPIKRSAGGDNYIMNHEATEVEESSPRITEIVVESEVVTSAPPPSPPLSPAPSSLPPPPLNETA